MTKSIKKKFVFTHGYYVEFATPHNQTFLMLTSPDVTHDELIIKMPHLKALSAGFATTLSKDEVLLYGQSSKNSLKSLDTNPLHKKAFKSLTGKSFVVCELNDGTKLLTNAPKELVEPYQNIKLAENVNRTSATYEFS